MRKSQVPSLRLDLGLVLVRLWVAAWLDLSVHAWLAASQVGHGATLKANQQSVTFDLPFSLPMTNLREVKSLLPYNISLKSDPANKAPKYPNMQIPHSHCIHFWEAEFILWSLKFECDNVISNLESVSKFLETTWMSHEIAKTLTFAAKCQLWWSCWYLQSAQQRSQKCPVKCALQRSHFTLHIQDSRPHIPVSWCDAWSNFRQRTKTPDDLILISDIEM